MSYIKMPNFTIVSSSKRQEELMDVSVNTAKKVADDRCDEWNEVTFLRDEKHRVIQITYPEDEELKKKNKPRIRKQTFTGEIDLNEYFAKLLQQAIDEDRM